MENLVETIVEKIPGIEFVIAEIVGEELRRAGRFYELTCPFHGGKDSFRIDPEKQRFQCYNGSCNEYGDVIDFVQKYCQLNFKEALCFLANKYNINIDSQNFKKVLKISKENKIKKKIYDLTTLFYQYQMTNTIEGKKAIKYLHSRGISNKSIKDFKIGYAPRGDKLIKFLRSKKIDGKNISNKFLLEIGLSNKKYQDFFQERIMFSNPFYGRSIKVNEKYPHLYLSGENTGLFNYNNAKKYEKVILLESHINLLSARQAIEETLGFENQLGFISSYGTNGFKEKYIEKIKFSKIKQFIIIYDGDKAGIERSIKIGYKLENYNYDVRVVQMPLGLDVNDYLYKENNSAEDFLNLIKKAVSPAEFEIMYLINKHKKNTITDRLETIKHIKPIFKKLQASDIEIEILAEFIAEKLKVSKERTLKSIFN
ncbi:MAG: CHC2 zinc finger domain-containing protein [archaeon]